MNRSPRRAAEVDIRRELYSCVCGNSSVLDVLLEFDKLLFCADSSKKNGFSVCLHSKSGMDEEENL